MQALKNLIFMSLLERKRSCHLSRFIGNFINLAPEWASNWCRWVPLRPESWQKWGLESISKNVQKKHWDLFKNCSKRGSQKSDRFEVFQGSIPAWSLGRPWGGSRAQKPVKMEAQTPIFYDFRKMFSRYLETLWKYFVCSLKNKLIVFDVNSLFLSMILQKFGASCQTIALALLSGCTSAPPILHAFW